MERRDFLKTGLALGAATMAPRAAFAANERVVLGIMGVNGRGSHLAQSFASLPEARVKWLCDVDPRVIPKVARKVVDAQKDEPKAIGDFRRILDDKEVDALVVAAPDHWHALATIHACQAGKDVYCEKPASHNVVEGRRMIQAARHEGRIVQVGTQRRSSPFFQKTIAEVRSGSKIGKVHMAKAINSQRRPAIGHAADTDTPPGVDYDLWLGAAPKRPFNPNRFHYNWHWFWDYGTGDLGNDGVHHVDVARWGLGMSAPEVVTCGGGQLDYRDDHQTPDTQIATYKVDDAVLVYEMRLWSPYGEHGFENGVVFYGTEGYMVLGDKGYQVFGAKDKLAESVEATDRGDVLHLRNFLECVKSRSQPNCDIEEGHHSAMICHLGNIASRTGRTVRFRATDESILDDPDASRLLTREYREPWALPRIG